MTHEPDLDLPTKMVGNSVGIQQNPNSRSTSGGTDNLPRAKCLTCGENIWFSTDGWGELVAYSWDRQEIHEHQGRAA